jgi:hypothetical protein
MAMGEAAGVAASLALDQGVSVARSIVARVQRILRAQGADPGDRPAANATFQEAADRRCSSDPRAARPPAMNAST